MPAANNITAQDLRKDLAEVLNRVAFGGEAVEITRHGKAVAVLMPPGEVAELRRLRGMLADREFESAADYVLGKNEKLYERLAK